jgi:hypothetical protein
MSGALGETDKIPEIEITPAMVEAGKWALVTHDPEHFSLDEIVESVGRAMLLVRPKEVDRLDYPSPPPDDS